MEGGENVEKITMGLALEELEAQRVELLPDRVEMHRRRTTRRSRNINCDQQAISVFALSLAANADQNCFII